MRVRMLPLLLITACIGLAPAAGRAAELTVLDEGWRFHLGAAPGGAITVTARSPALQPATVRIESQVSVPRVGE